MNTLQEQVESALDYEYDPVYVYIGDIDFDSATNTYTGIYPPAALDPHAMNDLARYLGALYRQDDSNIEEIVYDGTVYTWNTAEPLLGSNWEDGVGNTLVGDIVDDFQAATPPVLPYSITITVSDGVHFLDVTFVLDTL